MSRSFRAFYQTPIPENPLLTDVVTGLIDQIEALGWNIFIQWQAYTVEVFAWRTFRDPVTGKNHRILSPNHVFDIEDGAEIQEAFSVLLKTIVDLGPEATNPNCNDLKQDGPGGRVKGCSSATDEKTGFPIYDRPTNAALRR